jgi:UDP-4-amino-4,6-dideoxy-N-acetyl-beta-L-altrosamine N-acetyltransferase
MIEGKKIVLESVDSDHLEQFRTWRNKPELRKYFREYREISDKMQQEWFSKITKSSNEVNFSIKDKKTKQLIGHCGLYYINWPARSAEFGIYIGEVSHRNGGFGSDALRQLCGYGFDELNLNRIWCEVYSNNSSIGVYKHIGFVEEGILRESYFSEGKYWNSHMMSMLKVEYENQ